MTSPILVTGGTGTLGEHVVPLLREAGHDVRVLSRHGRESGDGVEYVTADLLKGEGIDAAMAGVETCTSRAVPRATTRRPATSYGPRPAPEYGTWSTFRSPARTRSRWATSGPSWAPSGPSPTPVCRGRHCGPRSSTTCS